MTDTITTQEIVKMIEQGTHNLYVRYSSGPESDRNGTSRDWAAGESHAAGTISANNLLPQEQRPVYDELGYLIDYEWLADLEFAHSYGLEKFATMNLKEYRFLPGRPWVMKAERVGTDSDGAPLVDSATFEFVGYWSE